MYMITKPKLKIFVSGFVLNFEGCYLSYLYKFCACHCYNSYCFLNFLNVISFEDLVPVLSGRSLTNRFRMKIFLFFFI